MLLLKATSDPTSFVMLKGPIRGLNLIDPLTGDRTNTRRKRDDLPRTSALKRNNILNHGELPCHSE
jgi:hypothetical protein